MKEKLISCLIGYCFGNFLTAELVARKYTGKDSSYLGDSGNPGMANIMLTLGFVPGILTLIGDVAKCLFAMFLVRYLFPDAEKSIMFYAGFGATIGHCFPIWRKFMGGKGVATTCIMIVVYSFLWGFVADVAGVIVVLTTKYLNLAGPVPPLVFAILMFITKDYEPAVMSLILFVIAMAKHWFFIRGIFNHTTEQTDVLGAIKKKLSKKQEKEETATVGNKIIVIGCPGSGKSTFSRKLQELTGLPLIHLDNVWWKPDRTHISREEFDQKLEEILKEESWILDGDYSRTYETRIQACDTVVFLDYGEKECMEGISERIGQERSDIPWTEEIEDPKLIEMVHNYVTTQRPVVLELLRKYPKKQKIIFRTRRQADTWLAEYDKKKES
ncbi:MAG: glycerol-3-phosphate acyltransferase [Erysipelotrichaceae bacterium]|nr:glycerol-3-phosphate acyltransferase [Erysipelotrichaceae bacterium]